MNLVPGQNNEESPAEFVRRLALPIKDLLLITRALTHRSYLNEHADALEDNERLEFLGDAVLDFLCGAWLYNHFPEMAEGALTRMRSALVCTEQLAAFARILNLGPAMRLGRGEIVGGGRERDVLLCATFEALVGALYLEAGISATQDFINPLFSTAVSSFHIEDDTFDPKSRLQEWSQSKRMGIPEYIVVESSGPDHNRSFEVEVYIKGKVYGHGDGQSKAMATRNAALDALQKLNQPSS